MSSRSGLAVGFLLLVGVAVQWVVGQTPDYTYDDVDSWSSTSGVGEQWEQYQGTSVTNGINRFGNQCDSTRRQSPVHVGWTTEPTRTCPDLHEPLVRQINPELDCRRGSLDFAITPHSLRAYFPLDDTACEKPTLTLSGRGDPYELLFLEIHARSEHVVEGRRYDAEIQMVHAGTGQGSGNIMTVSLLVDASAKQDNIEIEWLLQQWNAVAETEQAACSSRRRTTTAFADGNEPEQRGEDGQASLNKKKVLQVSDYLVEMSSSSEKKKRDNEHKRHRDLQFTPSPCRTDEFGNGCEPLGPRRRMFPYNLWQGIWYYGYGGSLSAPPCSENVQWRILDQPIQISRRQYKLLTSLMTKSRNDNCQFDTAVSLTGENFRPIQNEEPSNFFHCTNDDFGYFVYSPNNQ